MPTYKFYSKLKLFHNIRSGGQDPGPALAQCSLKSKAIVAYILRREDILCNISSENLHYHRRPHGSCVLIIIIIIIVIIIITFIIIITILIFIIIIIITIVIIIIIISITVIIIVIKIIVSPKSDHWISLQSGVCHTVVGEDQWKLKLVIILWMGRRITTPTTTISTTTKATTTRSGVG